MNNEEISQPLTYSNGQEHLLLRSFPTEREGKCIVHVKRPLDVVYVKGQICFQVNFDLT